MTVGESYHQNYGAIVSEKWMGDSDDFAVLIDEKPAVQGVLHLLSIGPTPERPSQDVGVAIPLRAVNFVLGRF
jgi:hypothetical protein